MWKKNMNREEVADLIERFLEGRELYIGEWMDFVETSQQDGNINKYRKRLYDLDPLVNCPGEQDRKAIEEMKSIVTELRSRKE
jgi:regulatory protein YycH of two-component signal transduction system YycFG